MKILLIVVAVLCPVAIYNYYHRAMRRIHSPHKIYNTEVQKFHIDHEGGTIYGELLSPAGTKADTLVIGSHGFNGSMLYFKQALGYRLSEEGIAVFAYDFINGSRHSKSGGAIEYMSAKDEVAQLKTVYEYFKKDYESIVLAGESQGGLISTLAVNSLDVKALILYYPAYVAVTDARKRLAEGNNDMHFGINFKTDYTRELAEYDLESEIKAISVPVILIHGDKDRTVDVSYAYWACGLDENIELHIIKDNNHGLTQKGREEAAEYVSAFLKKMIS